MSSTFGVAFLLNFIYSYVFSCLKKSSLFVHMVIKKEFMKMRFKFPNFRRRRKSNLNEIFVKEKNEKFHANLRKKKFEIFLTFINNSYTFFPLLKSYHFLSALWVNLYFLVKENLYFRV
jgi:hypothetical protein